MFLRPLSTYCSRRTLYMTPELLKGHNKWSNIKDIKAANDQIKSKKIAFLTRELKIAAVDGCDPKKNPKLAGVEAKFKAEGVGIDAFNKNRTNIVSNLLVLGPNKSAVILEFETVKGEEQKLAKELKKIIEKRGFKVIQSNETFSQITRTFDQKGVIRISDTTADGSKIELDKAEEICIEHECEEIEPVNDESGAQYEFICDSTHVYRISNRLRDQGMNVELSEVQYRAKVPVNLNQRDQQSIQDLIEQLRSEESIIGIYDNIEMLDPKAACSKT